MRADTSKSANTNESEQSPRPRLIRIIVKEFGCFVKVFSRDQLCICEDENVGSKHAIRVYVDFQLYFGRGEFFCEGCFCGPG